MASTLNAMLSPPVVPAYAPLDASQAPTLDPLGDNWTPENVFSLEGGRGGTNSIFNYPVAPTVEY